MPTRRRATQSEVRIGVFGLSPGNSNMGMSALCHSFVDMVHKRHPEFELILFDHGSGCRAGTLMVGAEEIRVTLCGAVGGVRLYRKENLHAARIWAGLGRMSRLSNLVGTVDSCSVIMDASAGDSFSDIYGHRRFQSIVLPKQIAARRSRPLLLLPQTYGPFMKQGNAQIAREAILASAEVWARDEHSLKVLKDLLDDEFDPAIHRSGIDMAFGLPVSRPGDSRIGNLEGWLDVKEKPVGFNVSKLVWNLDPKVAKSWGFRADYRKLVVNAVSWLLRNTDYRVLLIPHVLSPPGTAESDVEAAYELLGKLNLGGAAQERIRVVPNTLTEQELKWLIGRCAWFCGTRMHSTIAALSSGVPTASIVYSNKAAGVFERCGQLEHIIDPRQCDNEEALSRFVASFEARDRAKASLAKALVGVKELLEAQSESIVQFALRHARQ